MQMVARPTTNTRPRSALWVFLMLLADGPGGIGCGRTSMGDQPVSRAGGGAPQASKQDAGSGDHPIDGGSAAGGGAGASPNAASGGSAGVGGRGTGGAGGGAGRTSGAVTGGAGVGGRGSGGAGGTAGGAGGAVAGGTGSGGASAGPLWRDSHEAFCPRSNANSAFADVWSDDRGVFVLASDANSHLAIWSNIGTGWQMTFNWPGEANDLYQGGLKGFPDGPLVVYGGFPCGIQFVDGRGAECSAAANFVVDLSVVNASLAYAVNYDRVLQFDGKFWTQLGDPLPGVSWANAVWADSSTVVVGADGNGGGGLVFKIESGGAPVLQAGLSPQINPIAAWSFGASDIWVGDDQGQIVHYDGAGWSEMATIPYSGSGSRPVSRSGGAGTKLKLWGNNGSLFAIAGNIFGQWDGTRFKILDSLDSDAYFAGLWGNSPSEVFLAVHDGQSTADKCGPLRVWWFNGSVVGPL